MPEKKRKKEENKEKDEKTTDLESFSFSQPKSRKSRFFSLTTYASEKQIKNVMRDHIKSVRAFCYIYHDKDEAVSHYHILMRTHSTWTPTQLKRWFADLKDQENTSVNTFCEIAGDVDALERYILHDTTEAREAGKHQYTRDDVKDYGVYDLTDKKDSYDSSYEILLRVLAGANPRTLVRFYGRDYLYHINAYTECADRIREIEGYKEAAMISRMDIMSTPNFKKLETDELDQLSARF